MRYPHRQFQVDTFAAASANIVVALANIAAALAKVAAACSRRPARRLDLR